MRNEIYNYGTVCDAKAHLRRNAMNMSLYNYIHCMYDATQNN